MARWLLLGTWVCCSVWLHAQPQHEHWFFGFGAGLDLGTPVPTATPGPLSTDEGCSSISDANGQLLFFTNGETVWDRNLAPMPNGTGLAGHYSSSQSALIVPFPDDPDRYYVFTAPAEGGQWTGQPNAAYSVVDMTQNGGLGDVVQANVMLAGPVTEKLTAVRHANGRDVWVVYHGWNSDQYLAYLVTCVGVEGPVTSSIGYTPAPDALGYSGSAIGCMKLDRQGTRLGAVWTDPVTSTIQLYESRVIVNVVDFDAMTGLFSNLQSDTIGTGNGILKGYGVEWSPSGRFLYVNDNGLTSGINGVATSSVYQYDLQAPDPMATRTVVGGGNPAHGSMQLAPDGTLYIARLNGAQYLAGIVDPEVAGTGCGYVNAAVTLGGVPSTWGLPNHWDTYPEPPPPDPVAIADTLVCNALGGITLTAEWQHPFHSPTYLWSTGETTAGITVTDPGTYWVEVLLPCSTLTDTVRVDVGGIPVDLGPDLSLCEGNELLLAVEGHPAQVTWSTGSTEQAIVVDGPGMYGVQLTDSLGCVTQDEVMVTYRDCSCPLYLPNAFTPNGDGINDRFLPVHNCEVLDFALTVYDRWGREVFTSDSPDLAWDARGPLPEAPSVYVWKLSYSWNDGEGTRRAEKRGHVTVVR